MFHIPRFNKLWYSREFDAPEQSLTATHNYRETEVKLGHWVKSEQVFLLTFYSSIKSNKSAAADGLNACYRLLLGPFVTGSNV